MKPYSSYFKRTILKEADAVLPTQQTETPPEDSQVWDEQNPDIVNDDSINNEFDVQGLDRAEIEKYSEIIEKWKTGINTAIEELAQVIKFTANEKLMEAPGSEQFSKIVKIAPGIKEELSGLKSHIEDLSVIVKLSIRDEEKERINKLQSK